MDLGAYVERHGASVKRRIAARAGLRWQTVHHVATGRTTPRLETAKRISAATDGAVGVLELLRLTPADLAVGE